METLSIRAPGGLHVKVTAPQRGDFSDNLGGAVQFTLVRAAYNILDGLGESIGTVGAGALVSFLERIEPHLVQYVTPLLDGLLDSPELPGWFREYLQSIRNPQAEAGATLLQGFAGSVVNGATNTLVGALLAQTTYAVNKWKRPTMPDVASLYGMFFRGHLNYDELYDSVAKLGYHDRAISAFADLLRLRLGMPDLAQAVARRKIPPEQLRSELRLRGMTDNDVDVVLQLAFVPLSAGEIIRASFRSGWGKGETVKRLGEIGYTEANAGLIYDQALVIPGVADLVSMAVREAWNDGVAARFGYDEGLPGEFVDAAAKQGLAPEWSRRYWRAHWTLPGVSNAYSLLHRDIITRGDMDSLLVAADYPKFWRQALVEGSYSPYTRVDVRRMHAFGVLDDADLVRTYKDLGYDDEKAGRMAEFTIAYNNQADDPEGGGYRKLTQGLISTAYRRGVIGRDEAQEMLQALKYRDTDIQVILSVAEFQREIEASPDPLKNYRADVQKTIERAYFKGLMARGEALDLLGQAGFPQDQAEYILAAVDFSYTQYIEEMATSATKELFVTGLIDTNEAISRLGREGVPASMQEKLIHEWAIARDTHVKTMSESQLRDMVKYDLLTPEQYREELRRLGYAERYVDLFYRKLVLLQTGSSEEEV